MSTNLLFPVGRKRSSDPVPRREGGGEGALRALPLKLPRGLPRFAEAVVALLLLLLVSPVLILCALAVRLTSRGPVFFLHERVGRLGKTFRLRKLRTMRAGSAGAEITARGDSRVTPVGRLLRASKLDELPALWNVLRGDLALVGPRPEATRYVDRRDPLWRQVLRARPGLTDPTTLLLRNEEELLAGAPEPEAFYREKLLPFKLRHSARYLEQRNAWTDLAVLLRTAAAVLLPRRVPSLTLADFSAGPAAPAVAPAGEPLSLRRRLSNLFFRALQHGLDLAVLLGSFGLAYLLRFDFALSPQVRSELASQVPLVLGTELAALALAGVYSFVWRYVGLREVRSFASAFIHSTAALLILRLLLPAGPRGLRVPLSVAIMNGLLAFCGVVGLRVLRRMAYETRRGGAAGARNEPARRILLLGAGEAGIRAAREILGHRDGELDILGFVDDDPAKRGAVIAGVRVLGTTRDLPRLVHKLGIADIVITIARVSRKEIVRLVDVCRETGAKVRIIPGLSELLHGKVRVSRIRDVEISDLLGRERVELDEAAIGRFLAGRAVAVTGAGGSIGSELARQVARFSPKKLLLIERAEFALFEIEKELSRLCPGVPIVPLVADVGDRERVRSVFAEHRPQVVLHAAAHKHVPMMESNPAEAIKNNVLATRLLGEVASEQGVEAFVLISTDKAVRPASVMGASKRVAELIVQDLARRSATRFVAVRFGNVMGSAGSVIPIFQEQIRRGGPVTVTHPDMKRYFMTIPEAAQLVLQAGAMGRGGEIFILDMGEPVRIHELARAMIRLSGFKPDEEIEIVFTGLRPGEKLFEELELPYERVARTGHPKIFMGRIAPYPPETVRQALERLRALALDGDGAALREYLNTLLPEANLGTAPRPRPCAEAGPRRRDPLAGSLACPVEADGSLPAVPV